ncbi:MULTISPECIES: MFS transporter [Pseudonocardia]|uniref:Major Facilitator Superfamily protein n=2 Tax=Pseudonocardia TaxID=1847 RepID=A0A1Y2N8V1_PSEAH|nr:MULTISPECIES: MFS transporter [Pseudonocardia]OSY43894.1 Major Facilitator Superfamily protein [Pseudonocardia autotrophica]TDN74372.1 cyanate permease [Pseudonocardia autotrophica]BBG05137.1 MFS transporter [Pseudonocardia autotrophica]GEC27932.1 MFS transporter [Pseudonocardia saturnea]
MTTRAGRTVPAAPGTRTDWSVIAILVSAGLVVAFQVGKLAAALPTVAAELGMGAALSGAVLGSFNLVAALTGALVGVVTGRFGPERAVPAGLVVVALGSAAGAAATGPWMLLISTVVEGTGFVVVAVAAPSLVARAATERDSGVALGLWGTYMPGGQAAMILVAPFLVAAAGWRGLWLVNAVILVAVAALAVRMLGTGRSGASRTGTGRTSTGRPAGAAFRDIATAVRAPGPRLLALAFAGYSLQFVAVAGFLPTVYAEQGLTPATAGLLTAAVVLMNALGNLGAGILLRRGIPRWLLIAVAAAVMGVAAIGVYAPALSFAAGYACALVFSGVGGLLPAAVLAGVPVLAPHSGLVPVTNGLVVQGIGIGMVAGPVAVGALAQAVGGWHATPLVVTTTAALVVVVAFRLRRLEAAGAVRT